MRSMVNHRNNLLPWKLRYSIEKLDDTVHRIVVSSVKPAVGIAKSEIARCLGALRFSWPEVVGVAI